MQDKHTGNAFLTTFVGEYDALLEQQDDKSVARYNSHSLLSNQQLLTETDALLSSLDAPPCQRKLVNVVTQARATSATRMDDEQKRKHRNALAAVRRNRYRHKLRAEKEALELQELELSKLLNKLKAARMEKEINPGQQMMLSMWRTTAIREQEKRLKAETQNQELKATVLSRSNMIYNVQKLMQNLMVQRREDTKMDAAAWCGKEEDGAAVFRAFKAELDFMYTKTDEVLRGVEFKMAWPMAYSPKKRQQDGVELYESADATVLPYSYEEVCRAVSYIMLSDLEENETHQDQPLGNTSTIKYVMKCQLKGGENARLSSYSATRRFAEESRMVFVWRSLYEGHDCLSGFHADETGWFVVRPSLTVSSADTSGSDEDSSTILEIYTHFVPMGMKNASSSDVDKDRFAAVHIKAGEEEVKVIVRMLEKVLLGEKPVVSLSTTVNE